MSDYGKYEAVIGLEVHAQLNTHTKIFAADETAFGALPNTHISPITLGMPGVLPKLNKEVVDKAIKFGLACHSEISQQTFFARKNYFYADLPKGYQISQDKNPICVGGYVEINDAGVKKKIRLHHAHMEEDAGKNNHELDADFSLIDLNRAGVPLLEIVSEPDMHTPDEAYAYLHEIRKIVRYIDICDGNMEEGSLRCDANISIRLKGESILHTRVEVKNMNSIRHVKKAIENEIKRQIDLVENGGEVVQETRSFHAEDGSSFVLRSKENAHDYRYFPEPDLPPVLISNEKLEQLKSTMPLLPNALFLQFTQAYHLSEQDAFMLTEDRDTAYFFLDMIRHSSNYKAVSNWLNGEIKSYLNDNHLKITDLKLRPEQLAEIIILSDENKINSTGAKTIFYHLLENTNQTALQAAESLNLMQSSDKDELTLWATQVLESMPDKVAEYKKGKKGTINLFVGNVMKLSKGKAEPKQITQILEAILSQ